MTLCPNVRNHRIDAQKNKGYNILYALFMHTHDVHTDIAI